MTLASDVLEVLALSEERRISPFRAAVIYCSKRGDKLTDAILLALIATEKTGAEVWAADTIRGYGQFNRPITEWDVEVAEAGQVDDIRNGYVVHVEDPTLLWDFRLDEWTRTPEDSVEILVGEYEGIKRAYANHPEYANWRYTGSRDQV